MNDPLRPNFGKLGFTIPSVINSIDASTDILNRAPDNIAMIKLALLERREDVEDIRAVIISQNTDKKQDEKESIFQLDKTAKAARHLVNNAEAMEIRWIQAEKSAAKFYAIR